MEDSPSALRTVVEAVTSPYCDCSGLDALIRALDSKVAHGKLTLKDAITRSTELIDLDCRGKKPDPDRLIQGCGSPEDVCGHCKGPRFLIEKALDIRFDNQ